MGSPPTINFLHAKLTRVMSVRRNDRRSVRNPDRRRAAQLPRPEGLRDGAARLIKSKNPHSMVEVKDLQSGDVTAVSLSQGKRCP